jgi:hypothetical protein
VTIRLAAENCLKIRLITLLGKIILDDYFREDWIACWSGTCGVKYSTPVTQKSQRGWKTDMEKNCDAPGGVI